MDAHYEEGNRFYKEGKIEKAYDQYSLGLDMSSSPYPSDSATITASTYFKLLSNRSICAIQLRNYEQALALIEAGATRIGASSGVSILKGGMLEDSY